MIDGASILCNAAGEKRLKLSMKLPLNGDQLIGMPNWVSAPFDVIAKPDNAGKALVSTMELDPMLLHVYALPEAKKEAMVFDAVRMCNFKIEHDPENNVALTFSAYLPRTGKFLKFADENYGSSLFIEYEAAQPSLLEDNPNVQATDPKVKASDVLTDQEEDDDDEEDDEGADEQDVAAEGAAAQAVSELDPSRDAEFRTAHEASVLKAKQKKAPPKKAPPKKRDGYGKPIAASVH